MGPVDHVGVHQTASSRESPSSEVSSDKGFEKVLSKMETD